MAQLETKRIRQGMIYSYNEKIIILNVFKYFRRHFPENSVSDAVRRTAEATGCGERSVYMFRKEEASPEGVKPAPRKRVRKTVQINSRDVKYDNTVRLAIRNIIYDLKYRNIVPSLKTILKHVNDAPQLPNFSLMTLRRLMRDMGICYKKDGKKTVLVDQFPIKQEIKEEPL
ncbi:hypothetical protein BDFB_002031 [Asbolus verrucosus]|uniref:Uncharacterized protein n=1 Tax=Asbolus verrucosus TaxID=1661398 RepID=A0A482VFB8_ASBVE|nr:hypothetical protein BDFB_002031 [Asbolus verrucosus]